jgi:hypothetical protein
MVKSQLQQQFKHGGIITNLPHSIEEAAIVRRDHPPHDNTFHLGSPTEQTIKR